MRKIIAVLSALILSFSYVSMPPLTSKLSMEVELRLIAEHSSQNLSTPILNEMQDITIQTNLDWPMFRHDAMHTGYSGCFGVDKANLSWKFKAQGGFLSSPAVVQGKVYIGCLDSKLYCINVSTGKEVWNYTTKAGIESSPAVFKGKILIGSNDKNIYCIDSETGQLVWNFTTGASVKSSPTVVNENVYVGSYDGKLYCLNLTTGAEVWNATASYYIHTSPAVGYSRVFYGSCDGFLYCVNMSTGKPVWKFDSGSYIPSSPSLYKGNVFVGSYSNKIYCVNISTGKEVWNFTTGDQIYSSPAVTGNRVFFGSQDKNIYCLNATTGSRVWNYSCGGIVDSSPALADNRVYIGCANKLLCLDSSNGELIWSYQMGDVKSSPAVINGRVFIGSSDNSVYCFKESAQKLARIEISPKDAITEPGGEVHFVAVGYSTADERIEGLKFNWSVSSLGSIDQNGLFRALERDADMDTVPDDIDPCPNDFNNDGIKDMDTHHDVDGDGVKDYPYGPDNYLNVTLPSNLPSQYAGKNVSIRLSQEGLFYSPATVTAWIGTVVAETNLTVRLAGETKVKGQDWTGVFVLATGIALIVVFLYLVWRRKKFEKEPRKKRRRKLSKKAKQI